MRKGGKTTERDSRGCALDGIDSVPDTASVEEKKIGQLGAPDSRRGPIGDGPHASIHLEAEDA